MKLKDVSLDGIPTTFLWGAATSSYQIEGGAAVGDRGRCIWDDLCDVPGAISDGATETRGIEHIKYLEDDLELMKSLGLNTYRFSISWPRVQPGGEGEFSEVGMSFYDRLINGLLARGILPNLTLYHWDLPSELQAIGGWANGKVVDKFVIYAAKMAQRYGDRVQFWATFNEPWCITYLGHANGVHAPGIKDLATTVKVAHQLVRAHALASVAIKKYAANAKVGVVLNLADPLLVGPTSDVIEQDIKLLDGFLNRWWLEGMLKGTYPEDIVAHFEKLTGIRIDEKEIGDVSKGRDWLGLNYYGASVLTAGSGDSVHPGTKYIAGTNIGIEKTDIGWSWTPDGITRVLHRINDLFPQIPIYITENGAAYNTGLDSRSEVNDNKREEYMACYINACLNAMREGVNLKGYYTWSLFDNFEWAWGFSMRFGIVYVDYASMKRIPKLSAKAYRALINTN